MSSCHSNEHAPQPFFLKINLPIRTQSEFNSNENRWEKNRRQKSQKATVFLAMHPWRGKISLPCHVHLVRIAPRELDRHDNLCGSFKYILDEICEAIIPGLAPGRADGDKRISVSYEQQRGDVNQYAVHITITKKKPMDLCDICKSKIQEDTSCSSSEKTIDAE